MSIKSLSAAAAKKLIAEYKADKSALSAKLKATLKALKEAEKHYAKKAKEDAKKDAAKAKKAAKKKPAAKKTTAKRGRPAAKKTTAKRGRPAAKKTTAKRGRPAAKKVTARKSSGGSRGRKMSYSEWDMLVLNKLKGGSTPVRTSSLIDAGSAHARKSGGKSDEKYVRAKIAASLQKLVNKTKEVTKVAAEGRGFSYKMK